MPGIRIVNLSGEWDMCRQDELRNTLETHSQEAVMILDLRECRYADSSALTEFVRLEKSRSAQGSEPARYVISSPSLLRILAITRLDEAFEVFDTMEEAVARRVHDNGQARPSIGA